MQVMTKTISFIQAIQVNTDRPKNQGEPVLVRAPLHMKCFRATFVVNNFGSNPYNNLWVASAPTNQEELCLYLSTTIVTKTAVAPSFDYSLFAPGIFTFDRRGVGYMEDEFYLYSEGAYITIIWEGIKEH